MKKITILTFLLLIFSCSKSQQSLQNETPNNSIIQTTISNLTSSVILTEDSAENQNDSQIIDFGSVKENSINQHRIYLKNDYHSTLTLNINNVIGLLNNSAFKFLKTDCEESLVQSDVCFIDFQLVHSSSLSYSPVSLNLVSLESNDLFGSITLVGQKEVKTLVKSYQFTNVGQSLIITNLSKAIRVYIKNDGDKVINPQINVPQEYSVSKTDCSGIFAKGRVCFLDLKINPLIDPNIVGVNKTINFDGKLFSITAGISTPNDALSCATNFSYIDDTCVQTTQIRSCNPQPANSSSGYEESLNGGIIWSTCKNYNCNSEYSNLAGICTLTNQSESCLIANGSGQRTSSDAGQTWSSCNILSCNASYSNISNSCLLTNQVQACTIENGVGSQSSTNGGITFGTCNVVNCNSAYTQVGNTCLLTNQSRSCLSQPANSNAGTESTTNGGVNWGDCTSYVCNSNYTNVGGSCVLSNQSQSCTIENGSGTQSSTNGGQSYGTCAVISCNSSYTQVGSTCSLTNQSKSCTITNGTGSQSSTDGGQNYGICTVQTCNANYSNVNNACSLTNNTIACSILNGTGTQSTTNGGVSYTTCAVQSCNTNYNIVGNACQYGIQATGGEITYTDSSGLNPRTAAQGGAYVGGYTVHTFKTGGSLVVSSGTISVDYLVVAGGGSGGSGYSGAHGGGGGAGGMKTGSFTVSPASYGVLIGAGGIAPTWNSSRGNQGGISSFASISTVGGGGGATNASYNPSIGGVGGSGGGGFGAAAGGVSDGGAGTAGEGYLGGNSGNASNGAVGAGGGGGAGGPGGNGNSAIDTNAISGNGGIGKLNSISGVAIYYAGGGGGGSAGVPGLGGLGGGSLGASTLPGTPNTGGGSGGGTGGINAGAGGSGIVIIRYRNQ